MEIETGNADAVPNTFDPAVVYADAPSVITEIGWITKQARKSHRSGSGASREFLLRTAAVCDRIALETVAARGPKAAPMAVMTAARAGLRLICHDSEHRGLSLRGAELVTDMDYREYVRQEYRAWSLTQPI